ncbi:MAG: hypothetical protein ACRDO4_03955 [Nocardioides sp.]
MSTRKNLAVVALAVAEMAAWTSLPAAGAPSAGQSACVAGGACYDSLAEALAASEAGDTVRLSAGTFAGGVTIDHSLRLVGTGAARTTIEGGGPVITVTSTKAHRPTVLISRLTVTGGVSHGDGVNAYGGGIFVPPVEVEGDVEPGASLTIDRVTVTRNRTAPTTTMDSPSGVKCPESDCPYAGSYGGGIGSFGDLTIRRSRITANIAGGRASDAFGGGVYSELGNVRVAQSKVSGNRAYPAEMGIGRFAEGGGLFVHSGTLRVTGSHVDRNRADLVTGWPVEAHGEPIDMNAHAGGIHAGAHVPTVVSNSTVNHNVARAIDPAGQPLAFDAGMLAHLSRLTMRNSEVSYNKIIVDAATTEDVAPVGSALEVNQASTITGSKIVGNSVRVNSDHGVAVASSGLAVYDFTETGNPGLVVVRDTKISGNTAVATSETGSASVVGAGLFNNTLLRVYDSQIRDNQGTASAPHASTQGGGVWNGVFLSGPPVELTLVRSTVTGNALTVTSSGERQGGGIYNSETWNSGRPGSPRTGQTSASAADRLTPVARVVTAAVGTVRLSTRDVGRVVRR